jgi:hypothetical protein
MADAAGAAPARVRTDAEAAPGTRSADFVRIHVETMLAPITGGFVDSTYRPSRDRSVPERYLQEHTPIPVGTAGFVRAMLDSREPDSTPRLETAALQPPASQNDLNSITPVSLPRPAPLPYISSAPRAPLVVSSAPPQLSAAATGAHGAAAAKPNATQDDLLEQERIVRRVLGEYTRAFERLDVRAAKAVWPSLDDRALQRAFEQLDGQQLRFASCGVSITGPDANARCRGNATYRPKVGTRVLHLNEREWTFNLSRGEDGWQIVNARMQ